jgi:predicted dehydrogenase
MADPLKTLLVGGSGSALEHALEGHRGYRLVARRDALGELEDAIEVVCVAGEPSGRAATALAAIRAGRHVAVATPFATTVADADAIVGAARERGVRATVLHRRASPYVARSAELVASGRLGLPWALQVTLVEPGAEAGASTRLLCDGVDAVCAISGLEVVNVHAVSHGALTCASLGLERGAIATVVAGSSPTHDVTGGLGRIVMLGSQGMLAHEHDRPRLEVRSNRSASASVASDAGSAAACAHGVLDDLERAIRTQREPACSLTDGRRALAVALAAAESAASGTHVQLQT